MSSIGIASLVFVFSFGFAMLGMAIGLPDYHKDPDSRDTVKLVMGLVATISALVLGLLIASAYSYFDGQRSELTSLSANLVLVDRLLVSYGPEAGAARATLREAVVEAKDQLWSNRTMQPQDFDAPDRYLMQLQNLQPKTGAERAAQTQAESFSSSIMQTRLLMANQHGSISGPFLVVLSFWICGLFFGFSLFTRPNPTVIGAVLFGTLAVSCTIFLILQLNDPYHGLMRISEAPIRAVLAEMGGSIPSSS
jgi:hypothetical protein